jgi:hypothetical protein
MEPEEPQSLENMDPPQVEEEQIEEPNIDIQQDDYNFDPIIVSGGEEEILFQSKSKEEIVLESIQKSQEELKALIGNQTNLFLKCLTL